MKYIKKEASFLRGVSTRETKVTGNIIYACSKCAGYMGKTRQQECNRCHNGEGVQIYPLLYKDKSKLTTLQLLRISIDLNKKATNSKNPKL